MVVRHPSLVAQHAYAVMRRWSRLPELSASAGQWLLVDTFYLALFA